MSTRKSLGTLSKLTALFLALILTVSGAIPALALEEDWESKITAELREKMESASADELIPVYIFQKNIDKEALAKRLLKETGYEVDAYEDPDRYEAEIKPQIAAELEALVGYEEAHKTYSIEETDLMKADIAATNEESDSLELSENLDLTISLVDRAVQEDRQEYRSAKLDITKDECGKVIDKILEKKEKSREVLYASAYTTTVILEATKQEIIDYAKSSNVEVVAFYADLSGKITSAEMEQVRVAGTGGTQSSGYLGTGVKVGILEAREGDKGTDGGRFYEDSPQMESDRIRFVPLKKGGTEIIPKEGGHATNVTAGVGGSAYTIDDYVIEGVVPKATIYQTAMSDGNPAQDIYDGIEQLADLGVSVINGSFGYRTDDVYNAIDLEVDTLIENTGVIFVGATGNEGRKNTPYVLSPAKAYNVISVGNMETKSNRVGQTDVTIGLPAPYKVFASSSWKESKNISNKPDIVAPGAVIGYVANNYSVRSGTGTSQAAPIVTGVVAQMVQANGYIAGNPSYAKSCLLLGANAEKVSAANLDNGSTNSAGTLLESSGAGFLDAVAAVKAAKNNNFYTDSVKYDKTTETYPRDVILPTKSVDLEAGETLRATLAWGKKFATPGGNVGTLDLLVKNGNGETVASCTSGNSAAGQSQNNVEILEFKAPEAGTYTLVVSDSKSIIGKVQALSLTWSIAGEKKSPTLSLSSTVTPTSPQPYSTIITMTATLSGADDNAGKEIKFVATSISSTLTFSEIVGTAITGADGVATCQVQKLYANQHTISATFEGDDKNNLAASATTFPYTIYKGEQADLSITDGDITKLLGDAEFTLKATGGSSSKEITWAGNNKNVATVDAYTGKVTIVGVGEATITATRPSDDNYNAVSTSITLTVLKKEQAALSITGGDITKFYGNAEFTLTATGGSTKGKITWASGNEDVATVAPTTGKVTIVGVGETTITATRPGNDDYNDVSMSITLTVKGIRLGDQELPIAINPDGSVTITKETFEAAAGEKDSVLLAIPFEEPTSTDEISVLSYTGILIEGQTKTVIPASSYKNNTMIMRITKAGTYGVANNPKSFIDIAGHWAEERGSIAYITSREIFQGTGADAFSPDTTMTRAMFVTALARLDGADLTGYTVSAFVDVDTTEHWWAYQAIAWAADNGIVTGTGVEGDIKYFSPDDDVTREQMAKALNDYIIYKGLTLDNTVNPVPFLDEDQVSPWATVHVKAIREYGLIEGKGGNYFAPTDNATRAEVAHLYRNFIELYVE